MKLSEKDFPILDVLDKKVITNQRELADHAGISLGQVNYVLKSLLEHGLVKVTNFAKNPKKISYVYRLTPKGLETKSVLAARFVMQKLSEYGDFKDKLGERLSVIEAQKQFRVFFVGPRAVGNLIDSVIREKNLGLILSGQCRSFEDLADYDTDFFDVILLFDGNGKHIKTLAVAMCVPLEKLMSFW